MPSTSRPKGARLAAALLALLVPLAVGCELLRNLDDLTGGEGGPPGLDAGEGPDIVAGGDADAAEGSAGDDSESCALDCLGGACEGGVCQPFKILDGLNRPFDVAVDDGGVVYWSELDNNGTTGNIWELLPKFPAVSRIVVSSDSPPRWIFLYAGSVYWTGTTPHGVVGRCPVVGGGCRFSLPDQADPPTSVIATDTSDPAHVNVPDFVVADTTGVYWTNRGHASQEDGSIVVCATSQCAQRGIRRIAVAQDSPEGLAVDDTYVYWANEGDPSLADGKVLAIHKTADADIDGGEVPLVLAAGLASPAYLALDAQNVYVTTQGGTAADGSVQDGQLLVIPKTGLGEAGVPGVPAQGQTGAYAIAIDPTGVYWTTAVPEGVVGWWPFAGPMKLLATGQPDPQGIALDPKSVYYTTYTQPGAVWRVAKGP